MELFLARNHAVMVHLPIGAAVLAAAAAVVVLFTRKRELEWSWAVLSLVALLSALPALATGSAAAKGRFNEEGKPYLEQGLLVSDTPANARIFRHQMLAIAGTAVAGLLSLLGIARLRGRNPNRFLVAALAVALTLLWGIGGHLGGQVLWGPDTFPVFNP